MFQWRENMRAKEGPNYKLEFVIGGPPISQALIPFNHRRLEGQGGPLIKIKFLLV